MEPIRRLTCKDAEGHWSEEQESALRKVKTLATDARFLHYRDPPCQLEVQCSASWKGLGAALMQCRQPIAYISQALTPTEQRYAQIEKECLAIVYALERFHQYTFGRSVLVYSDHKPLKSILRKPLASAPRQLQGMMMHLQSMTLQSVTNVVRNNVGFSVLSLAAATIKKQGQRICLFSVPNSSKKSGETNRKIESNAKEKVDRKYFPPRSVREETYCL